MIQIRKINKNQISEVVRVHNNSFKGFFLTQLGDNFLSLFYDSIRISKDGILLGAFIENDLVGFCAATSYSNGFNKRLIESSLFSYLWLAIKLFFTKPSALLRLLKNFTKKDPSISDKGEYAELLSIAVDINKQGLGIGKELLRGLEKELRQLSCTSLSLTTDFDNNEKTIAFYKRTGFSVLYEFVAWPNRKMYRLIKQLN